MQKGLTIIYWGFGKGKTTAAMGTALRALGQGLRVLVVQFMKGGAKEGWETGEQKILEKLMKTSLSPRSTAGRGEGEGKLEFHVAGKGWVKIQGDKKPFEDHEQAAREGLAFAKEQLARNKEQSGWNVVVLDEILSAVDSALLTVDDIKALIAAKLPDVHLLMTGHKEYPELTELADLVTRMEKVKHPYDQGVLAQKGIDF